jgi:hypothetical protein
MVVAPKMNQSLLLLLCSVLNLKVTTTADSRSYCSSLLLHDLRLLKLIFFRYLLWRLFDSKVQSKGGGKDSREEEHQETGF